MNVDVNYTKRNYKKRVSRDEVCLIVEVHVNCMYCSLRLGGIPVITVIFYYRDGFIYNFLHN